MQSEIMDRKHIRSLLRELGKHGGLARLLSIGLPFVSGLLILVQAYLLASILGRAITGGASLAELTAEIVMLASIIAIRGLFSFAGERAASTASERINFNLRTSLFSNLLAAQPNSNSNRVSGAAAAAIIEQVDQLEGYYSRYIPAMLQAACLPLAFGIAVAQLDLIVGILFLGTAPMIPLFMALVGWGAEAAMRHHAQAMTRLSGHFADRLRGIVTLKLFDRAEPEAHNIHEAGTTLREHTLRVLKIAFLSSAVLEFFAALGVAGVALYVGLSYLGFLEIGAGLSLQTGLFCLLMAPEVYQPLRLLAAHYHDRKSAESALVEIESRAGKIGNRVFHPEPKEPETQRNLPKAHAGIDVRARDLSIIMPNGRAIFKEANFQLDSGSHSVLVGESGIGKTTLLHAIAHLRSFIGEILFEGEPVVGIPESYFRQDVAILNQRPFLFRGTVAENLLFANPNAADVDLARAAEMAQLFSDRTGRSIRLDTRIGDGGDGLSGGQAQRLSLARMFLRNPRLILLDEPTAHLDASTESQILDALRDFATNRTMLIATHSPAVMERFQKVLRIVDCNILTLVNTKHIDTNSEKANAA